MQRRTIFLLCLPAFALVFFVLAQNLPLRDAVSDGAAALPYEQSLAQLQHGNLLFRQEKAQHPHQDGVRRVDLARNGQKPVAVVLACADSREAVELLFDQGLGDVFVVRVAGNVPSTAVLGSVEYAAMHLGVPLVVVVGHSKCGAVESAWEGGLHGNIAELLKPLEPIVEAVKEEFKGSGKSEAELLQIVAERNAAASAAAIRESSPMREKVAGGTLRVLSAMYDLTSGVVSWAPGQSVSMQTPAENP